MKKSHLIILIISFLLINTAVPAVFAQEDAVPQLPELDPNTPVKPVDEGGYSPSKSTKSVSGNGVLTPATGPLKAAIEPEVPAKKEEAPLFQALGPDGSRAIVFSTPDRITIRFNTEANQKSKVIRTPFFQRAGQKLKEVKYRYDNILELTWENGLTRHVILRPDDVDAEAVDGWIDGDEQMLIYQSEKKDDTVYFYDLTTGEQYEKTFETLAVGEIVGFTPEGDHLIVTAAKDNVFYVVSLEEKELPIEVTDVAAGEMLGRKLKLEEIEELEVEENKLFIEIKDGSIFEFLLSKEKPSKKVSE